MVDAISPLLNVLGTAFVAVVAGVLSYIAGRGMKTLEWCLALLKEKSVIRQRLYSDFLAEADRLMLLSIGKKVSDPVEFHALLRKFAEIELLAPEGVSEAARAFIDCVMASHVVGQRDDAETVDGTGTYKLKSKFIALAKQELRSFEQ